MGLVYSSAHLLGDEPILPDCLITESLVRIDLDPYDLYILVLRPDFSLSNYSFSHRNLCFYGWVLVNYIGVYYKYYWRYCNYSV